MPKTSRAETRRIEQLEKALAKNQLSDWCDLHTYNSEMFLFARSIGGKCLFLNFYTHQAFHFVLPDEVRDLLVQGDVFFMALEKEGREWTVRYCSNPYTAVDWEHS